MNDILEVLDDLEQLEDHFDKTTLQYFMKKYQERAKKYEKMLEEDFHSEILL